jgi:hypothetical protein
MPIDKYDFGTHTIFTNTFCEMWEIMEDSLLGLDPEDIAEIKVIDDRLVPVSNGDGQTRLEYEINIDDGIYFEVTIDNIADYIYLVYVSNEFAVFYLRIFDGKDGFTSKVTDEVDDYIGKILNGQYRRI